MIPLSKQLSMSFPTVFFIYVFFHSFVQDWIQSMLGILNKFGFLYYMDFNLNNDWNNMIDISHVHPIVSIFSLKITKIAFSWLMVRVDCNNDGKCSVGTYVYIIKIFGQ